MVTMAKKKGIDDSILDKGDKAIEEDRQAMLAKWKEAHKKDDKKAKKPRK